MDKMIQTNLTKEKETLFICLRAKALESRSSNSILKDTKADEILKSIDYNFDKFKAAASFDDDLPNVWRAKHFDDWIKEFIAANSNAVVVYMGCGLDTRVSRINLPASVIWFDVDYPEVIELRKNFFSENPRYKMIASSVTAPEWLEKIPAGRPAIIVAEGVLPYLAPEDVAKLLNRITDHFPHGIILFDTVSTSIIKLGRKMVKDMTGAVHRWGLDDAKEIEHFAPKLKKISEMPILKSVYVKNLPFGLFKIFCRLGVLLPFFRRAMRLFQYEF